MGPHKNKIPPPGCCIFFTGLSGSGKTTLGKALFAELEKIQSQPLSALDGDDIRKSSSRNLGFSRKHRSIHVRQVGKMALQEVLDGKIVLCSLIAPYQEDREFNRKLISEAGRYIEVYLSTPVRVCEKRDPKGLYAKAKSGDIKNFTGLDDPYESPENPEIEIDTSSLTVQESLTIIIDYLTKNNLIRKNHKMEPEESSPSHFEKRSITYDKSSGWVDDQSLLHKIFELTAPTKESRVLDLAVGTGKVSQLFFGKVREVVGLDNCQDMAHQSLRFVNKLVVENAESMSFPDNSFNICTCRQGLQFMDVERVLQQIYRVLKPGGIFVGAHLVSYQEEDSETTFLIQKLRNPARRNFFMPHDFRRLLDRHNFLNIEDHEFITRESVNRWANNGAIGQERIAEITKVYKESSPEFKIIHKIEFTKGDIFDSMKMLLVRAEKAHKS